MAASDKVFAGSIPEIYDRFLVPLIFESYARDLAARAGARATARSSGNGGGNRRSHATARVTASGARAHRRDRSQSADARSRRGETGRCEPGRMASGRCARAAVRGSEFRCRRVPVRRDVLSRQGPGLPRGAPRSQDRRPVLLQCLGRDRGKRIRRCRHAGRGSAVSAGPAPIPGAHPARLSRRGNDQTATRRGRVYRRSRPSLSTKQAGPRRRAILRLPIARGPRCATKSRRAIRHGSKRPPRGRPKRWRSDLAAERSKAASEHMW